MNGGDWRDSKAGDKWGGTVALAIILGSLLLGWAMDRADCRSLIECLTRGEPWR
jgi:hypothetical protein